MQVIYYFCLAWYQIHYYYYYYQYYYCISDTINTITVDDAKSRWALPHHQLLTAMQRDMTSKNL